VLAEFPSPVEAVRSALEIQHAIEEAVSSLPEDNRMQFRIGINLGDVMIEGEDLIGDGVNVAARLQGLSPPGGICISGAVHEQVRNKLALAWNDLGDQPVKNIAEPVRAFLAQIEGRGTRRSEPARIMRPRRIVLAGAVIALVLTLGALVANFGWRSPSSPDYSLASIAVLPFANLSGDPAQEYFSDGTTEDITAALGRFADLAVTAHVAVQPYKGNRLTLSVVGRLAIKIEDLERQRALKKPTDNLDAYDLVLRGRDAYARNTRSANNEARKLFEQAIQLDPTYASAYAALGKTRTIAVGLGWTEFPDDAFEQAERLARKAIDLDKDNAEAHRLLGDVYSYRGQYELAIGEFGRAIELSAPIRPSCNG
jgi:adenylate cyclase